MILDVGTISVSVEKYCNSFHCISVIVDTRAKSWAALRKIAATRLVNCRNAHNRGLLAQDRRGRLVKLEALCT